MADKAVERKFDGDEQSSYLLFEVNIVNLSKMGTSYRTV